MGARAVLGAFCIFAHPLLTATLGRKTGLIVEVEVETQKGQLPCLGLVYPSINGNNIVLSLYYNSAVIVKPVVGGESPKRFLSAATAHQQLKSFAGIDQIQPCDPAVGLGLPLLLRHSYGVKEKASIWKADVLLAP